MIHFHTKAVGGLQGLKKQGIAAMELTVAALAPNLKSDGTQQGVYAASMELLQKFKDIIQALGVSVNLPSKEQALLVLGNAYDEYVRPIDIPKIPNFVEDSIDDLFKAGLLSLAGQFYDKVAV